MKYKQSKIQNQRMQQGPEFILFADPSLLIIIACTKREA